MTTIFWKPGSPDDAREEDLGHAAGRQALDDLVFTETAADADVGREPDPSQRVVAEDLAQQLQRTLSPSGESSVHARCTSVRSQFQVDRC